jgi:hypothetical protein
MCRLFQHGKRLVLAAVATTALAAIWLPSAGAASRAPSIDRLGRTTTATAVHPPVSAALPELRATYSTIDFPGARWTISTGVRRTGPLGRTAEVIGTYGDSNGNPHGFVMSGGNYRTLAFPGATETYPQGINGRGEIVGMYAPPPPNDGLCSFLYSGGHYSTILTACSIGRSYDIRATGINNSDDIVADYVNHVSGIRRGVLNVNGNNEFGYSSAGGNLSIDLTGINNNPIPVMVGSYSSQSGGHGLIFHGTEPTSGTSFDVPGAVYTNPYGVNDSGQIAGCYTSSSDHGFVDAAGSFSAIDYPGATRTCAYGIDNGSGVVAGYDVVGFYDTPGHEHGFIATTSMIGGVVASR